MRGLAWWFAASVACSGGEAPEPAHDTEVAAKDTDVAVAPPVAEPKEQDLTVGDYKIHVRVLGDAGKGAPVVALPDGPGLSHHYLAPLDRLKADDRAVVLVDLRGTGGSTLPAKDPGFTAADHVKDLEGVRAGLGVEQVHLVAHGFSAIPAMAYASAHPERVASLVLIDPFPAKIAEHEAAQKRYQTRREELIAAGKVLADAPTAAGNDCMPRARILWPVWYADPSKARSASFGKSTCTDVQAETYAGLAKWDLTKDLAKVTAPVLVVAPAKTPYGAEMATAVHTALPGSQKADLADCGHVPFDECPDAFFAAVDGFFASPPARKPAAPPEPAKAGDVKPK